MTGPASWPPCVPSTTRPSSIRRLEPTRAAGPARPGWCRRSSCGIARRPRPKGAALLHALAHIEFNAVNLALDIIWRFMPAAFYLDWLRVARRGLSLRAAEPAPGQPGPCHGDFPHTTACGTWPSAPVDLLARLALVPRTLEARGLDASPMIRDKLNSVGDAESAAVLISSWPTRSAMWRSATAGSSICARSRAGTPWPATRNWRIARRASPARSVQSGSAPRRRFRRNRTGGFAGRFSNPVIMRSNRMKPAHPSPPSRRASHDPARCCWAALAASLPAMPAVAADSFDGCLAGCVRRR